VQRGPPLEILHDLGLTLGELGESHAGGFSIHVGARHVDELVSVLDLGLEKRGVEIFELGILEGRGNDPETLGAAAFDQRGDEQPIQESRLAPVAHARHQPVDVGVLDVLDQRQAARCHECVDLAKVLELFLGHRDQRRDDAGAIRVFHHQAHGERRCLALAVGMILKKGVEVGEHHLHPIGMGSDEKIDRLAGHVSGDASTHMATGLRHAKEYLAKHQYGHRPVAERDASPPHPDLGLVVVIPCHDEPDALATLECLRRCRRPRAAVEILVIVNASESDSDAVGRQNRATVDALHTWKARFDAPRLALRVLEFPRLPARHAGVGLARKLGMDDALARLAAAGNTDGIIACLDADCAIDADYLHALESHFETHPGARACTVYFEHDLEGPLEPDLYRAMTHYELFLRYYRHGLRFAGFPHAFYTLGSCMAVRAEAYARHGGMNRRRAGEDFYFLNKLMAVGGLTENCATRVRPGTRASTRTPFGTGQALAKRLATRSGAWLTYAPAVFKDLATLVARVDAYYDVAPGAWRPDAALAACMADFLDAHDITARHAEIRSNCARRASFRKRFFQWFDASRALKFVHYATRRKHPREPLEQACCTLLAWQGEHGRLSAGELLDALRRRDRAPPVDPP